MATDSILHQVIIDTEDGAKRLLDAMERAQALSDALAPPTISCMDCNCENIKTFCGDIQNRQT